MSTQWIRYKMLLYLEQDVINMNTLSNTITLERVDREPYMTPL